MEVLYQEAKSREGTFDPNFNAIIGEFEVDLDIHNLEKVIYLANYIGGPQIKNVPGKGYGLFADRDYFEREFVTRYGGVPVDFEEATGDYVITSERFQVGRDAEKRFKIKEKGRWINDIETPLSRNVELHYEKGEFVFKVWFRATVKKGDEFLWNYGEEYHRPWLANCVVCNMDRVQWKCPCEQATYCSMKCQVVDWKRSHSQVCSEGLTME